MYRPIGITNGNETLIELRLQKVNGRFADFWLPACWFGFFFDVFVIFTLFIFKKQRKFPACIVGLFCCVDAIHFMRELVKGSPIPSINERFFWTPTQNDCATIFLWVCWVEAADLVLALSLAIVLYRTIVLKEDLSYEARKSFFLTVLAILLIYPFVYATIVGSVATSQGGYNLKATSCAPTGQGAGIIGMIQCFSALAILIYFLTISLRRPLYSVIGDDRPSEDIYIWQVVKNAKFGSDSDENSRAWLIVRFVLAIILQTAPRISYNTYYLVLAVDTHVTEAQTLAAGWAGAVVPIVCYLLNACVALAGNRCLWEWLFGKRLYGATEKYSSIRDSSLEGKHQKHETTELKTITKGGVDVEVSFTS